MWTQIYLSPEFPILAIVGIGGIIALVVCIIALVALVISATNARRSRKLLETFTQRLTPQGEEVMSIMKGILGENQGPISGNEGIEEQALRDLVRQSGQQATGLVRVVNALSIRRATLAEAEHMNGHIRDAQQVLKDLEAQHAATAPLYRESALGESASAPASLGEHPQAPQPQSASEDRITPPDSGTQIHATSTDTHREISEEEAREIILETTCVHPQFKGAKIDINTPYQIESLPEHLFAGLLQFFRTRSSNPQASVRDKQLYSFLARIQSQRNG